MGVINTNQWYDYPMYLVEVAIGDLESGGQAYAFWIGNFSGFTASSGSGTIPTEPATQGVSPPNSLGGGGVPDISLSAPGSSAYASLLSAIKIWAENFDWATFSSTDNSYSSIQVTKYDESAADVTP